MRVLDPEDLMNSALAGLVSNTAACNNVDNFSSFIIGYLATIILIFAKKLLKKNKIDDPIRFFQIFGISGIWGCLAVGLFDNDTGLIFTG